jgi:multidrug transporter EmrE-like cation transporter
MPSFENILPGFGYKVSASTNNYIKLLLGAFLLAGGEVLLKVGSGTSTGDADSMLNFAALAHAGTWLGIILYVANFAVWLDVLRTMPVGIAFSIQSVIQLIVPIAASAFLNEQISVGRALGITLVFAGVLLAAAPSARAEERL